MKVDAECQKIISGLGEKLKTILKEEGNVSNRKFAKLANISESTLRTVIKGSPNLELRTLLKLSLALNTTPVDLLVNSATQCSIRTTPLAESKFQTAFHLEKQKIGRRMALLQNFRKINAETHSLLSFDIDYSDTIKYMKGEKNITLLTLLKYSRGLEIELLTLLDDSSPLPTNKFQGKIKEK